MFKNSGVAYAKDGQLVPKLVGTVHLVARAGSSSADVQVDVVCGVTAEAVPIEQNHKILVSLEPGKYELRLTLPSPRRVAVEWRGAPYCNSTSTGTEHVSICLVRTQRGGGVALDNPAYLLDGGTSKVSMDGVQLYEVP